MIKKIIKLILILLCMISIFLFSSDNGEESTEKSDGLIVRISEFLVGHKLSNKEREEKIDKYVVFIRKSAHFGIYFILGFLLMSYITEYKIISTKAILIAFSIAFIYACSDEIHQLLVPGRSGRILDVLIDSIGSFCGIEVDILLHKLRRKYHG